MAHIDFLDEQIIALGQQIEAQLATLVPAGSELSASTDMPIPPDQPLSPVLAVELLDTIPGVNQTIAEVIVAELGLDMSRFKSAKQAAAWAGLAPGNNESGGKRRSGQIREGNQALRSSLSQAAWAAARAKETYLAALYGRLAARRGKKRAIVAVAHSILVSAYHMLARHQPYRELGGNYFDERKKEALVNHLTQRIQKLGYSVQLEPLPVAA